MKAVRVDALETTLVRQIARKIGGVDFGLEADEVVVPERGYQPLVIGQRRENLRRRERDVNEETDLVLVPALAQRLGQRNQMIVVHPHHVVGPQQLLEIAGEEFIDTKIAA